MNNNCLFNAAVIGFMSGVSQTWIQSSTAADYLQLKDAAVAFATQVDSKIAFDSLITTASNNATMLVDTASNTIQSNTQMRPALLQGICTSVMSNRYTTDATAADYDTIATRIAALYTESLLGLTSP